MAVHQEPRPADAGRPEEAGRERSGEAAGGGEAACQLHRVCPECGAMLDQAPPAVCWRCGAEVRPA